MALRKSRPNKLHGDSWIRRRLSVDPNCYFCARRVYNPRNRAQAPTGQVATLDLKTVKGPDHESNYVLICEECKEARTSMTPQEFLKRAQTMRAAAGDG